MANLIKLLQESNAQVNAERVLITCQEKTTNTLQQQLIDMTKQQDLLYASYVLAVVIICPYCIGLKQHEF